MLDLKEETMETTDIEKNNLEAHVELCAERYDNLKERLDTLDERMNKISGDLDTITRLVSDMHTSRQNQLVNVGAWVITTLLGAVGYLVYYIMTHDKS